MTLRAPPTTPRGLPPAHGGCTCSCHRVPGVLHVVACCRAGGRDHRIPPFPIDPAFKDMPAGEVIGGEAPAAFVPGDDVTDPHCLMTMAAGMDAYGHRGDARRLRAASAEIIRLRAAWAASTGGWTFSPQDGTPGHCHLAQVWDGQGRALATIEPTDDPAVASDRARLIAAAPELLHALETALPVLEATQRLITAEAAKRGMEPDDALLNRMRAAIAKATP